MLKSTLFFWQSMGTQNANFTKFYFILLLHKAKNHFKKDLLPWMPELFLSDCFFTIIDKKNSYFWIKSVIFFLQSMITQNANFTQFYFILLLHKTKKTFQKKFAPLAARAIFVRPLFAFFDKSSYFWTKWAIFFVHMSGNLQQLVHP